MRGGDVQFGNRRERDGAGSIPLAELVAQFEEGAKLLKVCQKELKEAELKIQKLLEKDDGTLDLEDFDDN